MATSSPLPSKPVLNATRARQGRSGRDVLIVLLVSTVLAVAALLVAWALKFQDLDATRHNDRASAAQVQTIDQPRPAP